MKFRSTKTLVPAAVLGTALLVGGGVLWATASGDDLDGADRDRAAEAALAEVGDGTVTDTSAGDDADDPAYEVEVTRRDGGEVDVALDEDFAVVFVDDDRDDDDRPSGSDDGLPAGDDRRLTGEVRTQAEAAAVAAVGGGTVESSEADDSDDDRGVYEVLVRATDNTLWQVELDDAFTVVDRDIED